MHRQQCRVWLQQLAPPSGADGRLPRASRSLSSPRVRPLHHGPSYVWRAGSRRAVQPAAAMVIDQLCAGLRSAELTAEARPRTGE